jgi:hypothetical protein
MFNGGLAFFELGSFSRFHFFKKEVVGHRGAEPQSHAPAIGSSTTLALAFIARLHKKKRSDLV